MHLRCIGGKLDGSTCKYKSGLKIGEAVKLSIPSKLTSINFNLEDVGPTAVMEYEIYIVDVLKFNDGQYTNEHYFLRHPSLSIWQAILHQFKK